MPPKRATTPGTSRKRASPADVGPTSRKRGHPTAGESSHRQPSLRFGPDNDQPGHHVPGDTRQSSPPKGALRHHASEARSDDSEADNDSDETSAGEMVDSDEERQQIREKYERAAEEELAELRARRRGHGGRRIREVDFAGEGDVFQRPSLSLTETELTRPRGYGDGIRAMHQQAFGSNTTTAAGGRSGTREGQVGVSAAAPQAGGGRKPRASTQSAGGGQPLGGDLPGLSVTEGVKNREGALASIFATKGSFKGFDKDEVLAHNMSLLVGGVVNYAHKYYAVAVPAKGRRAFFEGLLKREHRQLIRYLGCLAIAGNEGEQSWVKLLCDKTTREALVVGVLGRALKEHVFAHLWFGGRSGQVAAMEALEEGDAFANLDGFARTEKRAEAVKGFVAVKESAANKSALESACRRTALQLDALLAPFLASNMSGAANDERRRGLYDIVYLAGRLSRVMRQAPDVVYYWPPTFKDEEFEPSRMECVNLKDMIRTSPYEKKHVDGTDRAVAREGQPSDRMEAIVQIVCFPALVAYRPYGGETGRKEVEAEERGGRMREPDDVRRVRAARRVRNGVEEVADPDSHGFRCRVVCKSVVYLTWGQQRLLTREAGTSAHIDAVREGAAGMKKYEDDYRNYKELYDIAQARWGEDVEMEME